ncbi:MAG: phosphate ABC transporter permease subunit PstC [Elusimicrobia bacterium]|nr:phosphate ABC transporter permease subunit PstC [Elusimicrobiota bacterium]
MRWVERCIETTIRASAFTVILALVLIFVFIGKEALPILTSPSVRQEASLRQLFGTIVWQPVSTVPQYGLLPLLLGTLKVTVIALLVGGPLALSAALFTSEFAPPWVREVLKPSVELLAGIPSVVLGFFALMVLASWLQSVFGWTYRLNAVNAGIALAFAVIPIVYTVAEDALTSVPRSYREGSIAMGADAWQTAWRVVVPAAFPGIFAACVLGFGRAIGETMIVLMASGNAPIFSAALTDSARSLSATIAAELGEVVVGSAPYHVLFLIGSLLFVLTFLTNLAGHWFVTRLREKLEGR